MNEPDQPTEPPEDPREWEWAEDRDDPPPVAWQDRMSQDLGIPRWGEI